MISFLHLIKSSFVVCKDMQCECVYFNIQTGQNENLRYVDSKFPRNFSMISSDLYFLCILFHDISPMDTIYVYNEVKAFSLSHSCLINV